MNSTALRAAMVPITRRVRAYFAAVDRGTETAAVFDPAKAGRFELDAPPAPWIDLGWVDNVKRLCETKTETIQAGPVGAAVAQLRGPIDAAIEFDFREWGKLQMALAGGSEHMNVLASDPDAEAQPSGGRPVPAVALLPGSSAGELALGEGAVDAFSVNDLVAVDLDYQQQTGYVGSGVAAAYVSDTMAVLRDANYVRRVTFNVGRVAQKTATSLLLAQPLIGGPPGAGAAVQKVIAFVDREGGSFFQEWSGLFVFQEDGGGRACFYYPRLTPRLSGSGAGWEREGVVEIANPLRSLVLRASFTALPYTDGNDGQTVLCYRSYFPAAMAGAY